MFINSMLKSVSQKVREKCLDRLVGKNKNKLFLG